MAELLFLEVRLQTPQQKIFTQQPSEFWTSTLSTKKNLEYGDYLLRKAKQGEAESVEEYAAKLRELVEEFHF